MRRSSAPVRRCQSGAGELRKHTSIARVLTRNASSPTKAIDAESPGWLVEGRVRVSRGGSGRRNRLDCDKRPQRDPGSVATVGATRLKNGEKPGSGETNRETAGTRRGNRSPWWGNWRLFRRDQREWERRARLPVPDGDRNGLRVSLHQGVRRGSSPCVPPRVLPRVHRASHRGTPRVSPRHTARLTAQVPAQFLSERANTISLSEREALRSRLVGHRRRAN